MNRKTFTRVAASIAAVGAALSLAACSDGAAAAGDGDQPYIAIISKGFSQQFWVAVREGAEAAAEEHGARVSFVGPDSESEVAQQIEQLTTALSRRPDALAFAALATEPSIPLLDQAAADGIPIIAFDSGVESDHPITTVATDNFAAGAAAAAAMAEELGGVGEVAVVAHDQTSLSSVHRRDGFVDYIENNTDITIVGVQYTQADVFRAADVTRSFIQANPNLSGVFATNEANAVGMMTGVDELGRNDLITIGFDSGQGQIDAITEGRQTGAITQDPFNMGFQTVVAALAAINGEDLAPVIDTGYFFFHAGNIEEEHIARSLYQ